MRDRCPPLAFVILVAIACASLARADEPPEAKCLERAVAFLNVEVPKWAGENRCYSCHNNGDAVRALAAAGAKADRLALSDTLKFLSAPEHWDANGPEGPFKDKKLARVQFGAALAAAKRAQWTTANAALEKAGALVAELQSPSGNWETDTPADLGSPVTYGRHLTTCIAMGVLRAADARQYRARIERAEQWFRRAPGSGVVEASAALLALADCKTDWALAERLRAVSILRKGQASDGGWGPFVNSPSETFDTALAVLALGAQSDRGQFAEMIRRGRAYLVSTQQADGSWAATTRPSGRDSYAQQISTTAWAVLALCETAEAKPPTDR